MPATTIDLIQDAFRTAIESMVPRYVPGSSVHTWRYYEGEQPVRSDARWFRFEWTTVGYVDGGFMGPAMVDTEVTLQVITDYGGVRADVLKRVVEDDHYQIRDVLNRLKATVDGFRWLEATSTDFMNNDRDQARVAHRYMVRYMKARA